MPCKGSLGRIAAAHDVSIVQTRLLGILRDRHPTIKELAGFLQLDKSSVTGLVDRAEERGLVERIASTVDRRSVQVILTPPAKRPDRPSRGRLRGRTVRFSGRVDGHPTDNTSTTASLVVAAYAKQRGVDVSTMRSDRFVSLGPGRLRGDEDPTADEHGKVG